MKKLSQSKIIITTSLLISILALLISSTYAWLSVNRKIDSNGIELEIDQGLSIGMEGVDVFLYDINANKGTDCELDAQGNPTDTRYCLDSGLVINPYDLIFESRNRYTPVFARITITNMSALTSNEGSILLTLVRNPSESIMIAQNGFQYSCSSVLRFTAIVGPNQNALSPNDLYQYIDSTIDTGISNGSDTYKGLYELTKSKSGLNGNEDYSKIFVNSETQLTKNNSIELNVNFNQSDIDENDNLTVYLYISYDETLINIARSSVGLSQGAGQTELENANIIRLDNDLTELKIAVKDGGAS